MATIDEYLRVGREQEASDVHILVGRPPLLRKDGELAAVNGPELTADDTSAMIKEIMSDKLEKLFQERGSVDFAYQAEECGRFRVNTYRQARGICAACRVIPNRVIRVERLGLPPFVQNLTKLNSGLVLVTGATGTGKSTTLASLIHRLNETRNGRILTLEDPIEFVHESKRCLIVQREVGLHARSFASGLRAGLRQDPDIILVGEMRDLETITLALEASETGHLVFATLHTRGAVSTIERVLDAYPASQHNQVRNHLADNLKCVLSQELLRTADGQGRRAAVEILVNTPAVAQLIREGKTFQIQSVMSTSRKLGMQTMDHALLTLVQGGDIDGDSAFTLATDKRPFVRYVSKLSDFASLVGSTQMAA